MLLLMSDLHELSVHRDHMRCAFPRLLEHGGDSIHGFIHRDRIEKNLVDAHAFLFRISFTACSMYESSAAATARLARVAFKLLSQ